MRYAIRNCYDQRDHRMHAGAESDMRWICPGGRAGDREVREAETLGDLWHETMEKQA